MVKKINMKEKSKEDRKEQRGSKQVNPPRRKKTTKKESNKGRVTKIIKKDSKGLRTPLSSKTGEEKKKGLKVRKRNYSKRSFERKCFTKTQVTFFWENRLDT